jgi:L-asparaginase
LARQIVVFGTGGTIAGMAADAADHVGYRAGALEIGRLLASVPLLSQLPFTCEQVAQVDSKDMAFAIWRELALRCHAALAREDVQGIVITHGTDTLEETAWFLQRVLAPRKPVVLASAMRPASAASPDGPQNLVDAVAVARHDGACGVLSVSAGQVHGAPDIRKVHPYRLDAFGSGDAGPTALVESGRVRELRPWPSTGGDAGLLERVRSAMSGPGSRPSPAARGRTAVRWTRCVPQGCRDSSWQRRATARCTRTSKPPCCARRRTACACCGAPAAWKA